MECAIFNLAKVTESVQTNVPSVFLVTALRPLRKCPPPTSISQTNQTLTFICRGNVDGLLVWDEMDSHTRQNFTNQLGIVFFLEKVK